jgi:hypothetical protein
VVQSIIFVLNASRLWFFISNAEVFHFFESASTCTWQKPGGYIAGFVAKIFEWKSFFERRSP